MTPNRIVAFLTPVLFAPLAGAISAWVAENAPGVDLSQERLTSIFIAGAVVALAPALQWLHGWQKFEEREAQAERDVELANSTAAAATLAEPAEEPVSDEEPETETDTEPEAESEEDDALDALDALEDADELDEFEESEDPLVGEDADGVRAGV